MTEEPETFTCAMCKEVFNKGRSDEEAMAETAENFPDTMDEGLEVVCDDCYKQMTALVPARPWNDTMAEFREREA